MSLIDNVGLPIKESLPLVVTFEPARAARADPGVASGKMINPRRRTRALHGR